MRSKVFSYGQRSSLIVAYVLVFTVKLLLIESSVGLWVYYMSWSKYQISLELFSRIFNIEKSQNFLGHELTSNRIIALIYSNLRQFQQHCIPVYSNLVQFAAIYFHLHQCTPIFIKFHQFTPIYSSLHQFTQISSKIL